MALTEDQQTGWQLIETAPKDGSRVDLWAKCWIAASDLFQFQRFPNCWWMKEGEFGVKAHWCNLQESWYPTHWMPLPDPPVGVQQTDPAQGLK